MTDTANPKPFETEISRHIWDIKYRLRDNEEICDRTLSDSWRRIAHHLASIEPRDQALWEQRFFDMLTDFKFLPGGRIQAGAGSARRVTLFNCFVMGTLEDSLDGIFDGLKEGALTMQQGGGVGYDFSTLRPRGTSAKAVGSVASGPVSFMQIWDSMCATLLSTGARRGAMMATLRCDHPDIEEFIDAKKDSHRLRHFNISVLVSDEFMRAVANDDSWPLVFPRNDEETNSGETVERQWSGYSHPVACRVWRRVSARVLWERLMRATYDYAEPGVLFIDRINRLNNLWYREHISATNPCGEIPLPPYGACDLGSINLVPFVREPYSGRAHIDFDGIAATAETAVRLMDNVIDVSRFPLQAQAEQARGCRRIGLGFTGLADSLIMLGLSYADERGQRLAADVMRAICHTAYRSSVALAREKGAFPYYEAENYLHSGFIQSLPDNIQQAIATDGIRNSHLTAIAPTGTISLLANNVSSGIEPVFDFHYRRRMLERDNQYREYELSDYAYRHWRQIYGDAVLPATFVSARQLRPEDHLAMQAALQPYVDNSISKTINVPQKFGFDNCKDIYLMAYDQGLKGCTTFRPNPVTGAILKVDDPELQVPHCCSVEREAD